MGDKKFVLTVTIKREDDNAGVYYKVNIQIKTIVHFICITVSFIVQIYFYFEAKMH